MRWLADQCVDAGLVGRLRGVGRDVLYTAEIATGATDAQVIRRAHDAGRVLLTEDKDFGDLVFRPGMAVPGLVLLHVSPEKHLPQVDSPGSCSRAVRREADWALCRYRGGPVSIAAVAQVKTRIAAITLPANSK